LIKHYQIPLEKITVAPLAAGDDLKPIKNLAELKRVQKKYNLPECFILTLSTLEPRKNLATLLRAFEKITDPNLRLVVAGSGNPKIFSAPSLFTRDPRVHFCGAIAKEDRSALYSLAKIFVMPSLEEGFGLPVLEAMACGVPVVASNISSLPEVVGTAGLLVNPNNADEIANALKKILANAQLQKTLQGKSLERAKKFSWEKTVCLTLKEINSYFL
jgi:glycosyltransferase involved in cell wall biosynthesis